MTVESTIVSLFVYLIPFLFLFYMAIEVLLRNVQSKIHRLASLIVLGYMLLFLEEYIRHLLPIQYSAPLVAFWFGNVGALLTSFGFHFVAEVTSFKYRIPARLRPYIYYVPVLFVLVTVLSVSNVFNSSNFVQQGIWKLPIHNVPYFASITTGNILTLFFIYMIVQQRKVVDSLERKRIMDILLYSFVFVLGWNIVFGYIDFGPWLPPHPYIFAGVVWCFMLRMAMLKYDFLSSYSKRYEILFTLNPNAILLVDSKGMIKEANPTAQHFLEDANIKSRNVFEAYQATHQQEWIELYDKIFEKRQPVRQFEAEIESVKDGQIRHLLIDGDFLFVDQEPYFMIIIRNITSEKQKAEQVSFLAYHDSLTQLPNRRSFYQSLEERLQGHGPLYMAIILFDLDSFKQVNDQYGHAVGDEFLKHVAQEVTEFVSGKGFAARLGGDEFVICLDEIPSSDYVRGEVKTLLKRFKHNPYSREKIEIPIHASVGVSLYPEHGNEADELIKRADQSLYKVKNEGKNNFHMQGSEF
ncbi:MULTISPECIES: sensor domain-containing diguanylate cyclase [Pontibacillus]|uniref:Sensor domain-containing diguanylate cyclase n=1 Tax=Pontibacillus chungwhensis TaxID=265426 RepID=A0ABY8UWJ9_9BACI|nr:MULTISPECIES: sensor domain-containing diguanylate cyclase [Pontibacillus]MCD5325705.1 sensor domain-containing diguanylate cyclase [Pontibacillus sp. HN14]WIF98055.1 sensor domain-containing diguanylate cyclase [Pontibacillus chungwhensis]